VLAAVGHARTARSADRALEKLPIAVCTSVIGGGPPARHHSPGRWTCVHAHDTVKYRHKRVGVRGRGPLTGSHLDRSVRVGESPRGVTVS